MLYEINFDNTKNIKLNENIFNCSIKIAILNKTFNAGSIVSVNTTDTRNIVLNFFVDIIGNNFAELSNFLHFTF